MLVSQVGPWKVDDPRRRGGTSEWGPNYCVYLPFIPSISIDQLLNDEQMTGLYNDWQLEEFQLYERKAMLRFC